jgi:hypothetical protein
MLQVYQALSFREKVMLRYYLLSCLLFVPGFAAVAQDESPLSMNQNMIATASPLTGLKLASAADVMTSVTTTDSTMATLVPASKTRWFTANKLHHCCPVNRNKKGLNLNDLLQYKYDQTL